MDDSELPPSSPRKKLKLEEPLPSPNMADTVVEAPTVPEVNPHDQINATVEDQLTKPNTFGTTEVPGAESTSATVDVPDALDEGYSKEAACGITEFVSPDLLGFSGVLKKRYTDFLVNEILPSGEVVHLDNVKATRKAPQNTAPSKDAGEALSEDTTGQGPEAPPVTLEQAQPEPVPASTPKEQKQTIPHPVISNSEPTASKPEKDRPVTTVSQIVPQSMQGFDKYEQASDLHPDDQGKLAPHKRIPHPAPSIPLSMQNLDGEQPEAEQEKVTRRKEKVHIRQTSQGWVEFDKEKENEAKKHKAEEDAASAVLPEDSTQTEDNKSEKTADVSELQEPHSDYVPEASTQASWQAYAHSAPTSSFQLQAEDRNALLSYFSSDIVDEVLALYHRIIDSPHRKAKDYGVVTSGVIDRQKRTTIHQDIRRIFDSRLETMTNNDGAMMITAMAEKPSFYARTPISPKTRNNHRPSHRVNHQSNEPVNGRVNDQTVGRGNDDHSRAQLFNRPRGGPSWDELGGKYLHFSLYKENKDTMEAISWLSKNLKMSPKSFQFAGTKDRRAVTVQRVSVERVLIHAMIGAGRTLRQAWIGNFEYRPQPLQLGDLTGNEFVITLRDCDFHYPVPMESKIILEGAQAVVREAIHNLSERGFINYYGLQRFGTYALGTEVVGVKMLQGDFQGAVDAILDYSPASLAAAQNPVTGNTDRVSMDDRARAHALHSFRTTGKSFQALREMPRRYSAETSIIRHLTGRPNNRRDYQGALQTVSRNLRLMYVHAYQSLVWNVAASERWKRFGSSVIEGDLVLVNDHTDKVEGVKKHEDIDADGEAVVLPATDDRATNPDDIFERARALTAEEAESGSYSIFDIVLPSPGYDIIYPPNGMEKFYEEFMASEKGGGLNPHEMRRQWKDVSLSGSYRKILARPAKDISFEIKTYKDEDEQFVVTDLDRLGLESRLQRNGHSRHGTDNGAHRDTTAESTNDAEQGSGHDQEEEDSHMTQDSNNAVRGDDTGSLTKTKTASQESEDNEQGGVSLLGGPYRDYKIAVILKLQLGASQYATMALRELMKSGGLKSYKADFSGGR